MISWYSWLTLITRKDSNQFASQLLIHLYLQVTNVTKYDNVDTAALNNCTVSQAQNTLEIK